MKLKNLILATGLVVLSIACVNASDQDKTAKGYVINAKSDLPAKSLVILSQITDVKLEIKDSVYTSDKGDFTFTGDGSEESTLYYITFGTVQPPGVPLILENGAKVSMEIKKGTPSDVIMTGGKYNKHMLKLYNSYTGFEKEMAAFNTEVSLMDPAAVTEETRTKTTARYNQMIQARSVAIQEFIKTEPASPATYFAVKYLFQKPEPKLIVLGSQVMEKGLPNSSYTANLKAAASSLGATVEGALAPELNLKTPDGEMLALSSLRGKVVLIDFWASWCGPCRKENPHVKSIYEKYKDKGFEIYGVSLDNDATKWKAAIAKDGLGWKHVSDLGGWRSPAAKTYKVHSIPQTFLLDQEGRIVKSGFRSNQLEGLLSSLLD